MAGLFEYLDWRGDLTLEEAEFNEVDALIFAWLSYVDFDGIIPMECSETDTITIAEAAEQFEKTHDIEQYLKENVSSTKTSVLLLKRMAETERFGKLRLTGFVNTIDYKKEAQFCAMTILLYKNRSVVVFRGTDGHLISWKEDFNMSFLPVIPAQNMALSYLEEAASRIRGRMYICGHSKGGNLAVYSGVRASYRTRKKILGIYNFDGPGFYDLKILGDAYEEMLPKLHSFVPEDSVVGMLLERAGEQVVVKSSARGIAQHDALSWEVLGAGFVTVRSVSGKSRILTDILKQWLTEITNEEREVFVDTLYKILDASQARNLNDLNAEKGRIANAVLKEYGGLSKEAKGMLTKTITTLFREGNQVIKTNMGINKTKKK